MSTIDLSFLYNYYHKVPARQKEWHENNQVYSLVLCKTCNAVPVKWNIATKSYRTFCSSKCAHNHPSTRAKTERTCMTRFGARTNLLTDANKAKQRQTCLNRYGFDNFAKSPEFKERSVQTFMEKYGVSNPSLLPEIQEKITDTHVTRYGRKRASQQHIDVDIVDLKDNAEIMRHWFFDLKMPVSAIAEQLGVNHSQLCVHFKTNLGIDISRHTVSYPETQIFKFVKDLCPDAVQSDRSIISPKELDIVIPSKRIAIEFNGLAWHSEIRGNKPRSYHVDKMKLVNAAGYQLIQVLSSEWTNMPELVKSRLAAKLGYSQNRIYARHCTIRPLSKSEEREFFEYAHIQGWCVSKICYGLFDQDTLVAAMSFGKSRFTNAAKWELLRYASSINCSVIGGANRLFSAFVREHNPLSVISYCDLRWNTGQVYSQLGFVHQRDNGPNYWYVEKNQILHNRIRFQKHKLADLLPNFDPAQSEWQNMRSHNYDRIWDCGNSVWLWTR
jgi:hypothetical protein